MYDPCLHLFVDDHHIRNLLALKRVFGKPVKLREPALSDIPGRYVAWGCVLREADGRFRCWYQSVIPDSCHDMATAGVWGRGADYGYYPDRFPDSCREWETSVLSYAESADGLAWEKPELGLFEWRGSKANNIVLDGSGAARQFDRTLTNFDTPSVVRDDNAPESERYKFIAHWETIHVWDNRMSNLGRSDEDMKRFWAQRAKYITTSPDGIHWDAPLERLKECAGGGDYSGITRDDRNRRWWYNDRAPVGLPNFGFRSAGLCSSEDIRHWPGTVEQVCFLGEYEDFGVRFEHHGMIPFNYGDQDLGYLELSIKGAPVANLLLTHRDGQRWQLANGHEPFLALGQKGEPDSQIINAMRNPPLVVGSQLVIPYNGRMRIGETKRRDGFLCLAALRLDGFAGMSVDPVTVTRHDRAAVLQTQPIPVVADELQVNIEGHGGSARVALLQENASPIDGFRLEDCLPIDEDNVRAFVRWNQRPDIRALRGQRVIVMIRLTSGTVWSVRL